MNSIWTENIEAPHFQKLNKNIKTDVLIIGGGMCGLLCGYMLKKANIDYVLVEADRICGGITKNTTAKLTVQHSLIFDKLIKRFGQDFAKAYLNANQSALKEYDSLCKNIDCDYEKKDSFVYSIKKDLKSLEKEMEALDKIGCDAEFSSALSLPFSVTGAIKIPNQAQFHPLKFAYAIAKDLNIFENTKVLELAPNLAITNGGNISAKKIIVTTHFPFINKHGLYFINMYQSRSYVLGLKNAAVLDGMFIDDSEKGLSFRNFGDVLLLGGGSHRTGKKSKGWQELEEFARKYYPQSEPIYRWATQDCMTLDGVPYIGKYSKHSNDLYVATGFNKWGMTSSMVAAKLLVDIMLDKKSPYTEIFSPSRSIIRPQLAINVCETVINQLTPTVPRCPHLGCALKYNPYERSWDCPCHGSRFTEDKKLIDNPATDDMKK